MCGFPTQTPYKALVEGSEMILCPSCYSRLSRSGVAKPVREGKRASRPRRPRRVRGDYDIVPNYGEIVRRARESKGWSASVLAQKLRISEAMVRKIEAGKYKPPIDLARRMERVLKVKLLEPVIEEEYMGVEEEDYVTLGDIVVVRDEE